jgi:hypothetical protein
VIAIEPCPAARISFYGGARPEKVPAGGVLLLLTASGPHFLDVASSLCVEGYTAKGDEGITLACHEKLTIK